MRAVPIVAALSRHRCKGPCGRHIHAQCGNQFGDNEMDRICHNCSNGNEHRAAAAVPVEPALSALSCFAGSSLRLDARRAREEDFFIFSDCTASVAAAVSSSFDCLDFLPI